MKVYSKLIIFFAIASILCACHVRRGVRNPLIRKTCPIHQQSLIKARVANEVGAWSSIKFDKSVTPYPKIGVWIGCVSNDRESIIKYCTRCTEIYNLQK